MKKDFVRELRKFVTMVASGRHFALGRFADGEGCIVLNMGEREGGWLHRKRLTATWLHVPGHPVHEQFRRRLTAALRYSAPDYHIGLPCRSGHAPRYGHFFDRLKAMTRVPEEQLTFARLFHSYNYPAFKNEFLPAAFGRRKIFLVCNERADSSGLPHVIHRWDVSAVNASLRSPQVVEQIQAYIREKRIQGGVFLVAVGPSAAVFIHELWRADRKNTYVDIGSALDPLLFRTSPCRGMTRVYLVKHHLGTDDTKPFVWG